MRKTIRRKKELEIERIRDRIDIIRTKRKRKKEREKERKKEGIKEIRNGRETAKT